MLLKLKTKGNEFKPNAFKLKSQTCRKIGKIEKNQQILIRKLDFHYAFPSSRIKEGVGKIRSIANAYGSGEEIVETAFKLKESDTFVVIFKQSRYATALYHGLNGRAIDDSQICVSIPHPRTY